MKRKAFLRAAAAGAASLAFAPLLTACGGGSDLDETVLDETATTDELAQAKRGGPSRTGGSTPTQDGSGSTSTPSATLTAEEIADMRYMREEEKLAHDVYVAMFAKWGNRVFSNIAQSETEHTEAVLARLVAHGIDDPAAGKVPGEFENVELQALYDRLVAAGNESLVAALSVGALIEEKDIQAIRDKMAQTDEPDVLKTYQNLLCGSYNHLQAFNSQLVKRGVQYAAQVIPQETWDAIVAGTAVCTDSY